MNRSLFNNIDGKNSILKKRIVALCINEDGYSIADLSKELNTSIPTITKIVGELMDEGFLVDMGKLGTNGGRRPSIYGLNPSAGYFVGTDVKKNSISIAVTNFKGQTVDFLEDLPFTVQNSKASFKEHFRSLDRAITFALSGNVVLMRTQFMTAYNQNFRSGTQCGHQSAIHTLIHSSAAPPTESGVPASPLWHTAPAFAL